MLVFLEVCCFLFVLAMLLSNWRSAPQADPEWLKSMKGEESSLLSGSDIKFVSDVCSMIKSGMTARDEIPPVTRRTIEKDLPRIKEDLMGVFEHLKTSPAARWHFLETYLEWSFFRQNTVKQLRKIANSVDEDKKNCEIAQVIGGALSLLGGGMCLFADKKEQNATQTIGRVMMGVGNLTTAGTSAVGSILLHENIQTARKTIKEDREHLRNLWTWVKETTDVLKILDNVQSMRVDRSLQNAVRGLQAVSKKDMTVSCKQSAIKTILKSINCPQELRNGIADVVGILVSTSMLFDRYRPVFDLAVEGSNCIPRLRHAAELFQSAVRLNTDIGVRRSAQLTHAQRAKIVNGMAVDAVNIALTLLENDSQSVNSQKIREVALTLEDEADTFERLYDGMKKMNDLEQQHDCAYHRQRNHSSDHNAEFVYGKR